MKTEHTKLLKKCSTLLKVIGKQGEKPVHLQYLRKLMIEHTHTYPQDSKFLYLCNLKSDIKPLIHTLICTIQEETKKPEKKDIVVVTNDPKNNWKQDDLLIVENLDKFHKCLRQYLYNGGSCVSWYNYLKSQDPIHVDSLLDVSRILMNYVLPTDNVLRYCLEEWDGAHGSLVLFSSQLEKKFLHKHLSSMNGVHEWKKYLPLRSIFQRMSLNDIYNQYMMYTQKEENVTFEEYVREHGIVQKKTTIRFDPSCGLYTTHFQVPLYMYYHYCFPSSISIDENIIKKGFRVRFPSHLYPIRHSTGKWRFDDYEFEIPGLQPCHLLRRIQSILPEWTFLHHHRPSLVHVHYPGHVHTHKSRHQINTEMMWRQFLVSDLRDEDRYRLFAFCRMEMTECFKRFTHDTEKLFRKLEKKWEHECIGHVLDFSSFIKMCLSEQSPFCKYWISCELSHVLRSFRFRKTFIDVFHYHQFMDAYFVYWRLLPSELQTHVLRVFEVEALLDTYQRFFCNNDETIFDHHFVLLPPSMDWAHRLYHNQYNPMMNITMKPKTLPDERKSIDPQIMEYFESWRHCPSFSHDLIIDQDDIIFEMEEDEEWEEMEDTCDIDEENILIDDVD